MKNILITGGAGFIGSHVVKRFVNKYPNYNIYNVDNLTYAGNLSNLKDLEDKKNAETLEIKKGKVIFQDVSFAYDRDIGGVKNISLSINPGEKVGLVGASGAGKSTLVSLLLRLYDPERGIVQIDNQNLSNVLMVLF